jgi:hypothetical protein
MRMGRHRQRLTLHSRLAVPKRAYSLSINGNLPDADPRSGPLREFSIRADCRPTKAKDDQEARFKQQAHHSLSTHLPAP